MLKVILVIKKKWDLDIKTNKQKIKNKMTYSYVKEPLIDEHNITLMVFYYHFGWFFIHNHILLLYIVTCI